MRLSAIWRTPTIRRSSLRKMPMSLEALFGMRILIVEDEYPSRNRFGFTSFVGGR